MPLSLASIPVDCRRTVFWMAMASVFTSAAIAGEIIRPDSATATSEFSGSYVIANAINGSGLPVGFTPESEHATYVVGNHWTTRANQTIGQSATFTFATPKTLGGFYMWAHRSNNIAETPFYAVTRFDLVFRNTAGTVLQTLTNLPGVPNMLAAQTFAYVQIADVKSVQFIVRATANNNSSRYTGLAEVAFTDCVKAQANPEFLSVAVCPSAAATLSVPDYGTPPLQSMWEFESPTGGGTYVPVQEGGNAGTGGVSFVATGTAGGELVISSITLGDSADRVFFRRTIANACTQAVSLPIAVRLCPADATCDGFLSFEDFDEFVGLFEAGDSRADFNEDGFLTFEDFDAFVDAFELGC
jgi:hypothetical protein